jgi:signal peptidase I
VDVFLPVVTLMNATIREAIETIALAGLVFLLLQTMVQNYRVLGHSMDPTLANEELVLVNKAVYLTVDPVRISRFLPWVNAEEDEMWFPFYPPQRGDVVVFHNPKNPLGPDFVKRVIGEPGDLVEVERGTVFVNGEAINETYVDRQSADTHAGVLVEPGRYYVMGDNRLQSEDSREFGTVSGEDIVGEVWLGYWPLKQFGTLLSRLAW